MPRTALVFIGPMSGIAALVVCTSLLVPARPVEVAWWGALLLMMAMLVGEAGAVEITRDSDQAAYVVSVATIPHLAAVVLLPPPLAALLAGAAMLLDELRAQRPPPRLLFNVASTMSSVGIAALEANLLGLAGDRLGSGDWRQVPAFFGVAATYYALNTLPVNAIGALMGRGSFWRSVVLNARFTAPAEFALAVVGGLAGFVWVKDPMWLVAGLFPAV